MIGSQIWRSSSLGWSCDVVVLKLATILTVKLISHFEMKHSCEMMENYNKNEKIVLNIAVVNWS